MNIGQLELVRVLRSTVLTCLTVCVAGVAHVFGGGHLAPTWLMVTAVVVGIPVLYVLSARRWRFCQIVAFMAITQLLMHAVMSMSMPHSHHAAAHLSNHSADVKMASFHTLATLILAAGLSWGERALAWTLAALVRWVVLDPTPVAQWRKPQTHRVTLGQDLLWAASLPGRAPPVAFVS